MTKNIKRMLLICLVVIVPAGIYAQIPTQNRPPDNTQPINRYELLDKTWYFVALKCPDKIGSETHQIRYFMTLKLEFSNANNINYGTYVKYNRDMSDNPMETGTYSITSDEVGNVVLSLRKSKTNITAKYIVPMVETNHLTLIRTDGQDKCNVSYAIAP